MPVVEAELRNSHRGRAIVRRFATPLLLSAFSLYYFADVLLRASGKYFWFDELVTLDVCHLSTLHTMWDALSHGVDFNPPLFYIITNASKTLFGDNLIGPRVPEMIGFWVFCLCVFRFVSRRAGPLAGLIAMVLPTISGAFYYAYEARPHGLVLGFAGLAAVCWQMTLDEPRRRHWLVAFGVCLLVGLMLHCYALLLVFPFAVAEIVYSVRYRRINWPMWIALVGPGILACLLYVPLLISYRAVTKGTDWSFAYPPNLGNLANFYEFLLVPCILFMVWSFAILAADLIIGSRFYDSVQRERIGVGRSEVIVGATFVVLPVFGFMIARAIHGLFIERYFLSALLGISVLLGLAAGARKSVNWVAVTLAVLLAFPVTWQFSALVWHRHRGIPEKLIEPSSGFTMNSSLEGPLARYSKLLPEAGDSRPIAVLKPMDFLYLLHYAPQLRKRLYYVKASEIDFFYAGFENFHRWSAFTYNPGLTAREFVRLAPRSFVLGERGMLPELSHLVRAGGAITSMRVADDEDHFVAELETR